MKVNQVTGLCLTVKCGLMLCLLQNRGGASKRIVEIFRRIVEKSWEGVVIQMSVWLACLPHSSTLYFDLPLLLDGFWWLPNSCHFPPIFIPILSGKSEINLLKIYTHNVIYLHGISWTRRNKHMLSNLSHYTASCSSYAHGTQHWKKYRQTIFFPYSYRCMSILS